MGGFSTDGGPSAFSFRYNGEVGDIVVGRITEVKSYQIGFYKVKVSYDLMMIVVLLHAVTRKKDSLCLALT